MTPPSEPEERRSVSSDGTTTEDVSVAHLMSLTFFPQANEIHLSGEANFAIGTESAASGAQKVKRPKFRKRLTGYFVTTEICHTIACRVFFNSERRKRKPTPKCLCKGRRVQQVQISPFPKINSFKNCEIVNCEKIVN